MRADTRPAALWEAPAGAASPDQTNFGGASLVLGRIIVQSASSLKFDVKWAAILMAAIAGIVFYLIVAAVERLVIPWHSSVRSEAS